jgi:hypothetical protein
MDNTIIIYNFHRRRAVFDDCLKESGFNRCTCPSCGYPTISSRGNYKWCIICDWAYPDQAYYTMIDLGHRPITLLDVHREYNHHTNPWYDELIKMLQIGHVCMRP